MDRLDELTPDSAGEGVRIDLWAWSVRLFKSRTLAATACRKSRLLVNGQRCRASRQVRIGDRISVRQGLLDRTLEVKGLLRRRVGPKEVCAYLADLTPPEEYARVAELERLQREGAPHRETGSGRPTKRDRREIDQMDFSEIPDAGEDPSPSFDDFVRAFLRRPTR